MRGVAFESYSACFESENSIKNLLRDCAFVFNCKNVDTEDSNYSSGNTYYQYSNVKPRLALEAYAQAIFHQHCKGLKFDPNKSGYEWWTQVISDEDDIGFHWDRDYGEEENTGNHIYPTFATVTYLSNDGGPTIILNKVGTTNCKEDIEGNIHEVILSPCHSGKHIRFDGRLLHAAPSDILVPSPDDNYSDDEDDEEEEDSSDDDDDIVNEEEEEEEGGDDSSDNNSDSNSNQHMVLDNDSYFHHKRVTFLVNIWLDHKPSQASVFRLPSFASSREQKKKRQKTSTNSKSDWKNQLSRNIDVTMKFDTLTSDIVKSCDVNIPSSSSTTSSSNSSSSSSSSSIPDKVNIGQQLQENNSNNHTNNTMKMRKWHFHEGLEDNMKKYQITIPCYHPLYKYIEDTYHYDMHSGGNIYLTYSNHSNNDSNCIQIKQAIKSIK